MPKNCRAWIPLREVKLHLSYFTILIKNLTYFTNHYQIIFCLAHLWDGSHFPGASQSAGTANWTQECRSQNCTLNSKCKQMLVANGLAAQTCQFNKPCTNLAWCSFPGEPIIQNGSPNQPPTKIYKTAAKSFTDARSWHNTARE